MEKQFILRVPPFVAELIDCLLSENARPSGDKSLDVSFTEDGSTFVIGNEHFPAYILDLPCIVESYKTYDDSVLIKTADIGRPELVRHVEKDLQNIMAGGTAENMVIEVAEQEEYGEEKAWIANKKVEPKPPEKPDVSETGSAGQDPDRSDSEESDDLI